jgi:hypothetical protein
MILTGEQHSCVTNWRGGKSIPIYQTAECSLTE